MNRIFGFVACLAVLIVLATVPIAGAQSKLEGVWRTVEVTTSGPDASKITNPQPSLYIFTRKHYSIMGVSGDKPRPELPQQNATDAQLAAAWRPFTANSGTYEVKGNTLTVRPLVAKMPGVMAQGSFTTLDFTIDGNTLVLTQKANMTGPISNPSRFKLVRVE